MQGFLDEDGDGIDDRFEGKDVKVKAETKAAEATAATDGAEAAPVKAETVELVGNCPSNYPLQKKRHSLEFMRTIA